MALVSIKNLNGIALDWAIAKAEKLPIQLDPMGFHKDYPNCSQAGYWVWGEEVKSGNQLLIGSSYSPSSNWGQGGEIIEREKVELIPPYCEFKTWTAKLHDGDFQQEGATALEASMKAYVMSIFGDEIDIPHQLLTS